MSLHQLKVLLISGAAIGGLGLAGVAFADDGPSPDYSAPAVLAPVQLDLAAIQQPLRDLVNLSEPGAVVTTALVPDDNPSQILVTVSDHGGERATDATLNAAYIRSLVMAAPRGNKREALRDAIRLVTDRVVTMRDLTPTSTAS